MDRVEKIAFLTTIAALIGLECVATLLHRQSWASVFTPLSWTAMVRCADILLFLIMFRLLSVPLSVVGLKKFVRGSIAGLAVSLALGSGFFLLSHMTRSLWGVDLRTFANPGVTVRAPAPLVTLCLIGPFVEEIFFRGLCYTLIRGHSGMWISVILSALLFAAGHFLNAGAPAVALIPFIGGIVFALLYEYTGSLFAPFALHAVANFILFTRII